MRLLSGALAVGGRLRLSLNAGQTASGLLVAALPLSTVVVRTLLPLLALRRGLIRRRGRSGRRRAIDNRGQRQFKRQRLVWVTTDIRFRECLQRRHRCRRLNAFARRLQAFNLRPRERQRPSCASQRQQGVAQVRDHLTLESAEVDRVLLHRRQHSQPLCQLAAQRGRGQLHRAGVRTQAQRFLRRLERDGRSAHHPDLVKQIDPVAQRTRRLPRDQAQRIIGNLNRFRIRNLLQPRDHVVHADAAEIEPLTAAQHGRREFLGIRGRQDEHHMRRRLFQDLEQRLAGRLRESVDLVNQIHLESRRVRLIDGLGSQLSNVVNAAVGRRIDLDQIQVLSFAETQDARRRAAPVDRPSQDARSRGLARASRTAEQVGVRDLVLRDRVLERPHDRLLADHLVKVVRTPLAIQHRRAHDASPCSPLMAAR